MIAHFNDKVFPVGYHCENSSYRYYKDEGTQYWLILLIVVIIFFLCAILFESLSLPFVIISLIPVSFIGTFLTFYFSGINFGTGGFASLVLLCGIVVNAGIYVVNEYKDTRLRNQERGLRVSRLKMYVKAYKPQDHSCFSDHNFHHSGPDSLLYRQRYRRLLVFICRGHYRWFAFLYCGSGFYYAHFFAA